MTNPVDGATGAPVTAWSAATARTPGQLDHDDFLQLLVAQLRYQDPTSPMDTGQFMAQTSQLASVERLTELSTLTRRAFDLQTTLAAVSLVGRRIDYVTEDGATVSGTVDGVALDGPAPVLSVGDTDVALDRISSISTPTTPTTQP